jgi:hypothetical protein
LQTWLFFIPTPLFFLAATSSFFFSSLLFVRTQSPFHGRPPFLPTAAAGRPSSLARRKLPPCPWRPPLPPCFMGTAPSLICCSRHGGQPVGAAGVGCSCCAKVASLHSAPWTSAAHQRRALPMAPPPAASPLHQRPSLLHFFLCSRPLAAMALASAPCAACSARQGWRSAVEPLPSMGQQLLPRHLPLSSNHDNFALWRLPVLHSPVDSTTPPSTSAEACPTLYSAAPRSRAFPRSPATLALHGCSM